MDNYINKKVQIWEKLFDEFSSVDKRITRNYNIIIGIITNIYDKKIVELDNKILLNLDYIYKIEIVD